MVKSRSSDVNGQSSCTSCITTVTPRYPSGEGNWRGLVLIHFCSASSIKQNRRMMVTVVVVYFKIQITIILVYFYRRVSFFQLWLQASSKNIERDMNSASVSNPVRKKCMTLSRVRIRAFTCWDKGNSISELIKVWAIPLLNLPFYEYIFLQIGIENLRNGVMILQARGFWERNTSVNSC